MRDRIREASPPLFSIIVVNFNGGESILRCVASILNSEYPSFEIAVIDNGSKDGSPDLLATHFRENGRVKLIRNAKNLGPAAARNIGAQISNGKYLAFLDNDTQTEPRWLIQALEVMESDSKIGAVQCKLLLLDQHDKFDYAGDYLSQYGFLVQRVNSGATDTGRLNEVVSIFAAKSAGMIVRRDVFDRAGGFDEDYFIYMEETDLCWRIWLSGYKVVFVPNSVVYHNFGQAAKLGSRRVKFLAKYHGTKNYIVTMLKNLELANLVKIVPVHICLWIGIFLWHIAMGRLEEASWIRKGVMYNVVHLRHIWAKREAIQSSRKVSDSRLMPQIMKNMPMRYFYSKLVHPRSGWNA